MFTKNGEAKQVSIIEIWSQPARIFLDQNRLIEYMEFWVNGKYFGDDEDGFWNLWDSLTNEQKNSYELLKYLVRFS